MKMYALPAIGIGALLLGVGSGASAAFAETGGFPQKGDTCATVAWEGDATCWVVPPGSAAVYIDIRSDSGAYLGYHVDRDSQRVQEGKLGDELTIKRIQLSAGESFHLEDHHDPFRYSNKISISAVTPVP